MKYTIIARKDSGEVLATGTGNSLPEAVDNLHATQEDVIMESLLDLLEAIEKES